MLDEAANANLLYETLREVWRIKPFKLWAHSFIPDHINLLIQPTGNANIFRIMLSIQRSLAKLQGYLWNHRQSVVVATALLGSHHP